MTPSKKEVEMYVGWGDHTWSIVSVFIPEDTPEEKIEELARKELERELKDNPSIVCFTGIFHIWNDERA